MPRHVARPLLLALAAALLSACAQGATAKGMTLTAAELGPPPAPALAGAVAVADVGGGRETNPLGKSQIGDASFREALVESLRLAGLLSERGDAPLALQARLVTVDQPFMGFSMTVTSVVHYTVKDRSGTVLIDEDIEAEHTATMGEAFSGVERLKLANEGSARKNIAALVQRLKAIQIVVPVAQPNS